MSASFTIWYKPKDKKEKAKPQIDLHINLWIDIKKRDSIDFGLMIKNPKPIKELYFYVPFIIKQKNIVNLLDILSKDKESSDLVFNESITLGKKTGQIIEVTRGDHSFEYYLIDSIIEDTLDNIKLKDGRILKFIFDSNLSGDDIYLRFRINNIQNKGVVERHEKNVASFTGSYNTLTSMEINFNEFRKLPEDIHQKAHHNFVPISLVNLFVMTDVHMSHIFSNINNVKSRILEKNKWAKYNPSLEDNIVMNILKFFKFKKEKKILAYQFKKGPDKVGNSTQVNPLKDFSIFSKFNNEGVKKMSVAKAIVLAIFIGTLGSTAYAFLDFKFPNWEKSVEATLNFGDSNITKDTKRGD